MRPNPVREIGSVKILPPAVLCLAMPGPTNKDSFLDRRTILVVMARTKAALIETLSARAKIPVSRADLLVNHVFDCMADALARGERIEVRGFGTFSVRSYRAYLGRNPRSGEPVQVKEKRLAFFKVGKELRERVNGGPNASRGR